MKKSNQAQKLAEAIITKSKENGKVDEETLRKLINALSQSEDPIALQILSEIPKALQKEEKETTIFVQSAYNLEKKELKLIKDYFENKESKKLNLEFSVNKSLIGGIKI